MAKVGEEDPRWIVEDLGNKGTNVNDWHWTEVNVLPWCTERAHKLFDDKTIVKSKDISVTANVEQVSGEATVSNRKRKLLAFYELNITLKWNATIPQGGSATGKVNMPYISDESENDEIEVDAVADTKSQDAQTALKHMNQSGILAIKKILFDFLSELRAGANMASMVPPEEPKEEKEVKPVKEEKKSKKEGPLSQYEIIKDLSDGAFSKVKLAKHKETEELVAIKIIAVPVDEDDDDEFEGVEVVDLVGDDYDDDDDDDDDYSDEDESNNQIQYGEPATLTITVEENTSRTEFKEKSKTSQPQQEPQKKEPNRNQVLKKMHFEVVQQEIMGLKHISKMKQTVKDQEGSKYIVKFIDVVEDAAKQKLNVVLEYISGGDLFTVIEGEDFGLSEKRARHYFRQMVKGVEFMHNCNVCHRDLKPENILVDEETDCVKIGDFGHCGILKRDDSKFTTVCGTFNYVAPEVLAQEAPYDGRKADIWSLGCILFTMIAGIYPFDIEDDVQALVQQVMDVKYEFPPFFAPKLKDLIKQILVRDPDSRITLEQIQNHPWMK